MPGPCGALSLWISGRFYQESLDLDVKVKILEVEWRRGASEEGQIFLTCQGPRRPGPGDMCPLCHFPEEGEQLGTSPWISWAKSDVHHQREEGIRARRLSQHGCYKPSWEEDPAGKFLVDRLLQLFKIPVTIASLAGKPFPSAKP